MQRLIQTCIEESLMTNREHQKVSIQTAKVGTVKLQCHCKSPLPQGKKTDFAMATVKGQ